MRALRVSALNPDAAIHVDLDGAADIFATHGWAYRYADDPLFETGLTNFLVLCERNAIRATLFVIASSLDDPRKRALVEEGMRRGHEIASHSLTHLNLLHVSGDQKQREIAGSRDKLESLLGTTVHGFRAPGYQIDRESLECVARSGYGYDASVFPTEIMARRLGTNVEMLAAPHLPVAGSRLVELPLPDHRPSPFPFNPSYSLLFGMRYFRWGLDRIRRGVTPLIVLFHLTDLAEPLQRERSHGFKSRLFTLSHLSGHTKLAKCQRMLDLIRERYNIVPTQKLIERWQEWQERQRGASV